MDWLCICNLFKESLGETGWLEWLSNVLISVLSLFLAYKGYKTAKKEYDNHKDVKMATALSEYNQRYISNEYILNVIRYLEKEYEYTDILLNNSEVIFNNITSMSCYNKSKAYLFVGSIRLMKNSRERYSTKCAIKEAEKFINNIYTCVDEAALSNHLLKSAIDGLKTNIKLLKTNALKGVSTYDKDMCLRFFEEVEYAIRKKVLDEEEVYDIFSFYALIAYNLGAEFIDDFEKPYWSLFKGFCNRMNKVNRSRNQ